MLARDTKIYKDSYMLTKEVFGVTKKMKTEFRSSIARRLEELSIEISMRHYDSYDIRKRLVGMIKPEIWKRIYVKGHYDSIHKRMFAQQDSPKISNKEYPRVIYMKDPINYELLGRE